MCLVKFDVNLEHTILLLAKILPNLLVVDRIEVWYFVRNYEAWSSSSIFLRTWVTGTPPVTHTYIQAIKQPTLHHLTRSVRRWVATS